MIPANIFMASTGASQSLHRSDYMASVASSCKCAIIYRRAAAAKSYTAERIATQGTMP